MSPDRSGSTDAALVACALALAEANAISSEEISRWIDDQIGLRAAPPVWLVDASLAGEPEDNFVGMPADVLEDADGHLLGKALINAAAHPGGGSVEYPHVNPVSHKPEPKVSFVEKAGDDVCGVGAYRH